MGFSLRNLFSGPKSGFSSGGSSGGGGAGGGGGANFSGVGAGVWDLYNNSVSSANDTPIDNGSVDTGGGGGGYGSSRGGGGYSAPRYNAEDLQYLNDQEAKLRGMQGQADIALNQGLTSISDSFGREEQRKNEAQNRAMRDYQTKEDDTTRAKTGALERTNEGARTLANSVRRRLGLASGSSSSAYQIAAPSAVARDATKNRTGVMENFAVNFRDLNTARDDAKSQFEQMMEDLKLQRAEKERVLREGVLNNKNEIEAKISNLAAERAKLVGGGYGAQRVAQQPYEDAINTRQSQINALYDQFRTPFTPKPVTVKQPSLRDYMVEKTGVSPEKQQEQTYNDYLNQFKKQDEEQKLA